MTKCFFLEPTGDVRRSLRRYRGSERPCPVGKPLSYCDASVAIDVVTGKTVSGDLWPHDDPRWPTACSQCGGAFEATDAFQLFCEPIYQRKGTDEITTLREARPGDMWDAHWYSRKGPDGRSLVAICPDGRHWMIDSRASNCTMKEDSVHRCWVRHGEPPELTVDKNGVTCAAGAGSIDTGTWHGFLRNGAFVT